MSTNPINGTSSSNGTSSTNGTSSKPNAVEEQQDRFLKLLVTQMKNQDPLNPMDNAQVTTQMAQLSTVNGIDKLNSTLSTMSSSLVAAQSLQASTIIGHSVLANGDQLPLHDGQAIGGVLLAEPADHVNVTIKDKSGNVLQKKDIGEQPAGQISFSWDGKLDKGGQAKDGNYIFSVEAMREGNKVTVDPLSFGKVNSVSVGAQGLTLNIDGVGSVAMDKVKQILQ